MPPKAAAVLPQRPDDDEGAAVSMTPEQIAALVQQQIAVALQLHAPGAAAASRGPEEPRIAPPAPYDGKAAALDEWRADLEQQFAWYEMTRESRRLRFALAYLKGNARDWWTNLAEEDRDAVMSWDQLVAALSARFQPVTTADMARARLATLAQGKSPVHEYVTVFRKLLVSLSTMAEEDRLFAFLRGLQPTIAAQIRILGVKTVDSAIEMAVRAGSTGEYAALASSAGSAAAQKELNAMLGIEGLEPEETNGSSSSPSTCGSDQPITRAEFQQLLAVMQQSRRPQLPARRDGEQKAEGAGRGPLRYNGLNREQIDAHFAAGTCFECGKTGHRARDCPRRKSGK